MLLFPALSHSLTNTNRCYCPKTTQLALLCPRWPGSAGSSAAMSWAKTHPQTGALKSSSPSAPVLTEQPLWTCPPSKGLNYSMNDKPSGIHTKVGWGKKKSPQAFWLSFINHYRIKSLCGRGLCHLCWVVKSESSSRGMSSPREFTFIAAWFRIYL